MPATQIILWSIVALAPIATIFALIRILTGPRLISKLSFDNAAYLSLRCCRIDGGLSGRGGYRGWPLAKRLPWGVLMKPGLGCPPHGGLAQVLRRWVGCHGGIPLTHPWGAHWLPVGLIPLMTC